MKNFLKGLTVGLLGLSMVAGIAYAATLNFVQTPTDSLYASMSASATSMRITPYPKDLNGVKLTMTDFGTTPTVTIDPKVKNYEEIVSFTGITDNGDNTATLTGLTRNLASKSPYTTPGTGKTHGAGALVVFSNNPQMYARLAALENVESITGSWTFSTTPTITNAPVNSTDAVNKAYVDSGLLAGAATSTTAVTGISRLATAIQQASSTPTTANTPLVIQAQNATSTPVRGCDGTSIAGALCAIIARNNGTIHPNFIATSSSDVYNFGGNISLLSWTNIIASSTQYILNVGTINATSTIKLNGNNLNQSLTLFSGYSGVSTASSATTTLKTIAITANTLTSSNTLQGYASFSSPYNPAGDGTSYFQCDVGFGTGSATTTVAGVYNMSDGSFVQFWINATSTTAEVTRSISNNSSLGGGFGSYGSVGSFSTFGTQVQGFSTPQFSTTGILYLDFKCRNDAGSGKAQLDAASIQIIQ